MPENTNNGQMLTTFVRHTPEQISEAPSDFGQMAAKLTALAVLDAMAVYRYGLRALILILVCVAFCWGCDILCLVIKHKHLHIHDLSAAITGLAIAAMMPATVRYTVAAAACVFAICIAKHPLGSHGHEIFSCAAAGYIFAELSFPENVLQYPQGAFRFLANNITYGVTDSFTRSTMYATTVPYSDFDLLSGNFPGPMGCTFTILTLCVVFFLLITKSISPAIFFSEVGIVALYSLFRGGADGLKITLCGGMLLFSAAFFSADYNIAPSHTLARVVYGVLSGLLVIAVSKISVLENPAVYVCIIAAPFAHMFDRINVRIRHRRRAKRIFGEEDRQTEQPDGSPERNES